MKRTASRDARKRGDLDGFIEMRKDILSDPFKCWLAEPAARRRVTRRMAMDQSVDEAVGNIVPVVRPVRIAGFAFLRQDARDVEECSVISGQARLEFCAERSIFGGGKAEPARL